MRTWLTWLVLLLAVLTAAPAVHGQVRRPTAEVATRVETKAPKPGTTVRLIARVRLPQGLHVQSNKPREAGLIPTEVTLTPPAGVTLVDVVYPKAEDFVIPGYKLPLAVYPNEFDIVVRVRLGTQMKAGALSVPATLRYQACNDTVCFPPSRATLTWSVAVARG